MLPIFLSSPLLEVGMPVFLLKFCFACVIPKALFQEKESPGILTDDLFFILLSIFIQHILSYEHRLVETILRSSVLMDSPVSEVLSLSTSLQQPLQFPIEHLSFPQ